jgi:ChaC-like protein
VATSHSLSSDARTCSKKAQRNHKRFVGSLRAKNISFNNRFALNLLHKLMRSLLLHLASLSALQVHSFPLAHQATQRQLLHSTRMASDKSDSTAASSEATTGSNFVPEPVKAVWDAINGVWQGSKAARDEHDLPNPLWVFGYGSLCWKPETNWLGYVLAFCSRCNCSDFRCEQTCR